MRRAYRGWGRKATVGLAIDGTADRAHDIALGFRRALRHKPGMIGRRPSRGNALFAAIALCVVGGGGAIAQIEGGDRGVVPTDNAGSFEVNGIAVDVTGRTAEGARLGGWRLAQRRGWQMLAQRLNAGGGTPSDGTLDSLVSGIVVENEQIGPNRYVARLGVLFDRARAAAILGVGGEVTRSPPLLVIPVQFSGGVGAVFETRTAWQQAWARFRTGNSAIDYVRPSGTGPDPLILNVGQLGRPARGWWRTVLDQYGASDVVMPEVQLYRQWPGGPVIGVFSARYGPDNRLLRRFALRVEASGSLDALLDAGIKRIDEAYQQALQAGVLRVDPSLIAPVAPVAEPPVEDEVIETEDTAALANVGATLTIQFDAPDAGAVSATEASVRSVPGVRAAATTSLALGGVSVMRVIYDGDPAAIRSGLQARGWRVDEAGGTLRLRRAPVLAPPTLPSDDRVTG